MLKVGDVVAIALVCTLLGTIIRIAASNQVSFAKIEACNALKPELVGKCLSEIK